MLKEEVNSRIEQALSHQAEMLASDDENRLEIFRYEMEATDKMKRIYTLTKRIAKMILPEAVAAQAA